jgi:hypothetical protein
LCHNCFPMGKRNDLHPFGALRGCSHRFSAIPAAILAGVYKIAGVKVRKASNGAVLRRRLVYDLRGGRGVSLQRERREQALLHITHAS